MPLITMFAQTVELTFRACHCLPSARLPGQVRRARGPAWSAYARVPRGNNGMSWVWAVVAGLIVGVVARLIVPGKQAIPIWLTALIGLLGALAGNALASALGVRSTG